MPLILMIEACLIVDYDHKSQASKSTKNHYSMHFSDENVRMHTLIYGVFSCFLSKKPSWSELNPHNNSTLFLTADCIDPQIKKCVENEQVRINHEGSMREKSDRC